MDTKLLNGEIPEKAQTVLKSEGEYIVQKEAANCLAKLYQEESNVKLPRERTSQVREQLAQLQKQPTSHNCMSQPITMKEIEAAIRQLKCKKAPGPDGVTNDMIKHLGPAAKKALLELFNESWKNGTVPALWKKATIIPIHKKGKDKKDPNSYRPISLLSCLGKVLERVINRRLISFLEERKILSPTQTGYRKHRSTEDQLALIAQEIENAFQEKKKVVSVFFDLTKAFDKVWREGLLLKILESGISGKMYRWIRCFLQDRSARVKLDGHLSKSVKMREGVPQGGVISPTLFLLYINNITTVLPRHVSNTLHADDLAVWSASEYTISSAYRIQEAVNKVEQWTNDWGLQISEVKTQATVFSLSTSKEKVAIKLGDKTLPQVETPTFLGVKLDTRLSWKPHIEDMEKKGIKKLAVLKKLSGTHWGANSKILKTVYMGAVRPSLEYGASAWATAAKTHTNKLDKVQNIGLRTILGAMKTTPIAEMEKTAGVEPLEGRRQAKLLIHAEKMKRMPDHPLHQKLKDPTKNRLKRKSLNHLVKEQQKEHADILTTDGHLCEKLISNSWPPETLHAEIRTTIPGITTKENQSEAVLRALALEEMYKHYPAATWTHIYTDGSAENATRNGGCGAYIKRPDKPPLSVSAPGGILCSNYRAEVLALLNATETIISWEEKPKKAVFLTDSLSALQALMSDEPDTTQKKLTENINTLAQTTYVVLQWIPAHTGIRGNEMADQLAKEGREKEQPPSHLSYREVKTLIHNKKKAIFHCKTEGYNPNQDALHQLTRHQQTIIFRLRTGHCRLNSHLKRIGVKTSAQCPCGEADQTPEHYLQSCSLHQQARQQIWSTCVSLKTKLWGSAEDLLLTSRYAALAGESQRNHHIERGRRRIQSIWDQEKMPEDFRDALIVALYKNKGSKTDCGNYRGISLLSIAGKIFARIILNRLIAVSEANLPEAQCGFRPGRSTVDMIFTVRQVQEKCLEQNLDLYSVFIDLTKAFDTVNREALWDVLARFGCPPKFIQIICLFHVDMTGQVLSNGEQSDPFFISNGVKQGCVLAPVLFNLFFTCVLRQAIGNMDEGVYVRFRYDGSIFDLRRLSAKTKTFNSLIQEALFADDCALMAHKPGDLQAMLNRFSDASRQFGLTISLGKTEVLFQRAPNSVAPQPTISIDDAELKVVNSFKYLGSMISNDGSLDKEIASRISKAS